MATVYVYSTLTNDNCYGPWLVGGGDLPFKPNAVVIFGGANRTDKDDRLFTPLGVATAITEEQLEICKADPVFHRHLERGFLHVDTREVDADHVAADMTGRSKDAPLCEEDIAAENAQQSEEKRLETHTNVPTPAKVPAKRKVAPKVAKVSK